MSENTTPKQKDSEPQAKLDRKKEIFSWIRTFAITIGVALVLIFFVFINATVPSASMENTIKTGSRLIGFRFSYWFSSPKRGDIILFRFPLDESETYIKRVIGLPGETVTIHDGKVYIDDSEQPLTENYLKETWTWKTGDYTFEVPEDSYFVMGDNRNDSEDSRSWAEDAILEGKATTEKEANQYSFVRKSAIKGKAIWVYYKSPHLLTGTADYGKEQK